MDVLEMQSGAWFGWDRDQDTWIAREAGQCLRLWAKHAACPPVQQPLVSTTCVPRWLSWYKTVDPVDAWDLHTCLCKVCHCLMKRYFVASETFVGLAFGV